MEGITIDYHLNLIAKKQIKDIRGFYTHVIASFLILPFIIYINLKIVPQFHFFWLAFGGMFIGLFFHWLEVFGFEFLGLGKYWENKKIEEILKNYR
ncbi:2TM domain-containing protein [uncultured Polaribacter sp.]|uniref:2TM domain-containing protein n=1 Tax=uncultured Polaribacter sp. TaxID=174711 RepID=UPI00262B282A|nr:2TM domain-containing protein [uncultured Polaribacter sp.]